MPNRIRFNIALKVNIGVSILMIATAFILGYNCIRSQIRTVKAELKIRGESLVKNLSYNCELGVLANDKDSLDNMLQGIVSEKDVIYAAIFNAEDMMITESGISGDTDSTYEFISSVVTKVIPQSLGLEGMTIVPSGDLPEEAIGKAKLQISLQNLYNTIKLIQTKTIFLTIALILLTLIITVILTRIIIGPLFSLVEATHKVANGDLSYKVKMYSNDEIGDLALSFNEMTENLKTAYGKLEKRTQELELTNKELKEAQFKLVQSSKMAAIGQLGAGVAHELNNPLGGILGYAQYTLQKVRKPDFKQEDFKTCKTYLEYIERESLRCKTIVENLLKFSRGPKKEMEDVDFNRVVSETMPLTGHDLRSHKIEIIEEYDENLPIVQGNFNKLQQVVVNMMINAKHAMPDGGKLYLRTKTKKEGEKNIAVIVEIQDTGKGIAPENISKLFEPFFTTKQESKGTGLGLSVSYEIIQEHGGDITVESEANKGTKFIITIPVKNG